MAGRTTTPTESSAFPPAPFRHRKVVGWGDCDPAAVIYTPRAIDYANEALDAWYRDWLGSSWYFNNFKRKGTVGTPNVYTECTYFNPLHPDDRIDLVVGVKKIGTKSITFAIEAVRADARVAFRVIQTCVTVDPKRFRGVPIPTWMRQALTTYQALCRKAARARKRSQRN
jgi:4-hydroxybenzoyl-CoA thioesterase